MLGHTVRIKARKAEIRNRAGVSHLLHFMGSFQRLRFLGCVSRLDPTACTLWAFASCADITGRTSRAFFSLTHCIARASKADRPLFMKSMHLPQNDLMSTYRNAQSRLSTPENSPFHAAFVGAWRNSRRGNKLQFCLAGSMKISSQKRRGNPYPRTNKPPLNYLVHTI